MATTRRATKPKANQEDRDDQAAQVLSALAGEVEATKRLLVLLLLKAGSSQAELARALGVGQASVSRLGIGSVPPLRIEAKTVDYERKRSP